MSRIKLRGLYGIMGLIVVILVLPWVLGYWGAPVGKFRVDGMGTSKPAYFEFKDGRVMLVVEGIAPDDCGYYTNEHSSWIWVETGGATNMIRTTPFGIHINSLDGSWSKYLPRCNE